MRTTAYASSNWAVRDAICSGLGGLLRLGRRARVAARARLVRAGRVGLLGSRLAPAAAVVGRVEARALVVDCDGVEHTHERRLAADLAPLGARFVHAVE